jgi:hypothetical protein
MSLDIILNNKDYRLIFLKAIILGINYGKSPNVNYYLENIEREINKSNIENNPIENNPIEKNIKFLEKNNENLILEKYNNIIINLENQKKYILNYIQVLSKNYRLNHSKINLLRNNLFILNQEINKNILKKRNELNILSNKGSDKFISKNNINKNNFKFR